MRARHVIAASIVSSAMLSGCRGEGRKAPLPEATTTPTSTTATPSPPPTAGAPAPKDEWGWAGRWINDKCGKREYRRVIELMSGGTVRGEDLVSPCPPNVACVWSGIVPFEGTWKLVGSKVVLELKKTAYETMDLPPLPTELTWSGAPSAEENGVRCHYRRP